MPTFLIWRAYLSRCSSLIFGPVIIFFSLVHKSLVSSVSIKFAFALSVISVGVDIINFTVGNYSGIYCFTFSNFFHNFRCTIKWWALSSNAQKSSCQVFYVRPVLSRKIYHISLIWENNLCLKILLSLRPERIKSPVIRTVPFFQTFCHLNQ